MAFDALQIAVEARDMSRDSKNGLDAHEQICAVRYTSIDSRLENLEGFQAKLIWLMFATLLSSIGGLILLLVQLRTGH